MKYLIMLLLVSQCQAYDATIKDKYGRTVGYVDKDKNKTNIIGKYGKIEGSINKNGVVKDKYGRTTNYIRKSK